MPNEFWMTVTESLLLIPQFRNLELGLKMVPLDRVTKKMFSSFVEYSITEASAIVNGL